MVIASNRGPVSFVSDEEGGLSTRRGAGGLVSGLAPLVASSGSTWIAAAMSDADRRGAAQGTIDVDGYGYRCLDLSPEVYRAAYDVVSNSTLWFLYHHLFDLPRRPRIDRRWREAWEAYRAYNRSFAEAIDEAAMDEDVALVQDYHLSLVGSELAKRRPSLKTVHFLHTPFCDPSWLRVLPADVVGELIEGLSGFAAVGFHTKRWERAFLACCEELSTKAPTTFVAPLGPDISDLAGVAASDACRDEGRQLDSLLEGRKMILRVDRIEPSKNVLRGFHAYDALLEARPDLRGAVTFVALLYPSREGLSDYLAYHAEVETLVQNLNDRWGSSDWTPVLLDDKDNFPRSVAALERYDALLVNPVRDGLNLVAKEGAVLNRNHGSLALSTEAGAWEELGAVAIGLNPFDVEGTANALARCMDMGDEERRARSGELAAAASARGPSDWLADQLAAVGG